FLLSSPRRRPPPAPPPALPASCVASISSRAPFLSKQAGEQPTAPRSGAAGVLEGKSVGGALDPQPRSGAGEGAVAGARLGLGATATAGSRAVAGLLARVPRAQRLQPLHKTTTSHAASRDAWSLIAVVVCLWR
ncbi:unnamed protein product, partial [Urochloa humidicola]